MYFELESQHLYEVHELPFHLMCKLWDVYFSVGFCESFLLSEKAAAYIFLIFVPNTDRISPLYVCEFGVMITSG